MSEKTYNVLFLCTGNSARSVLAETILNREGKGHFKAFSAGSHPTGTVNLHAIEILRLNNYSTDGLRSKSWDEFAQPGAPVMDFVFTVCDNAAGEICPIWPGQPISAHWGFPDPAAFEGPIAETRAVFADVYRQIFTRVALFTALPIASLERLALQRRVDELGALPEG
jgi:protein-tyrosine-phosphatase